LLLCLLPLLVLIVSAVVGGLGANPAETMIHETGEWCLRFLLLGLCVTPLRLISGWHDLNKRFQLRKLFGLYAFFYGALHLVAYGLFEHSVDLSAIFSDIITRPAMTIGFIAFVLMIPLAITSNSRLIKWLGKQRWKQLHYLTYPIAIAAVVHFWWLAQTKADMSEPLIYAIVLAVLFLLRYPPLIDRLKNTKNK